MSRLSEILSRLFRREAQRMPELPFVHEVIDMDSYAVDDYVSWKKEGGVDRFVAFIERAYRDRVITGRDNRTYTTIMKGPYSNGWMIQAKDLQWADRDYKHMAYHLSQRVKEEKYVINLAEYRSRARGANIESFTHYYLKPSLSVRFPAVDGKARQLYGNVTIEYKSINERPATFKFMAHAYQDQLYHPPLDFDTLLRGIGLSI